MDPGHLGIDNILDGCIRRMDPSNFPDIVIWFELRVHHPHGRALHVWGTLASTHLRGAADRLHSLCEVFTLGCASHVDLLDRTTETILLLLDRSEEHAHLLSLLLLYLNHRVKVVQICIHLCVEDWITSQDKLNPWLEGKLIETEMP